MAMKDVINKVKGLFSESAVTGRANSKELSDSQGIKDTPKKDASYWITRLESSKLREQFWMRKARDYEVKYLNESDKGSLYHDHNTEGLDKLRYNIFYANTELLHCALLTEIPQPALERRFAKEQAQDPTKKQFFTTVSELMERALSHNVKNVELEREFDSFKYDYLISGRGVLWASYESDLDGQGNLKDESVKIEHISYRDFRISSGRSWKEVFWVARRHLLSRDDLVKRWGKLGKQIQLNYTDEDHKQFNISDIKRAEIWEIWDKTTKKVYFVCPTYKEAVLEELDDPYHLKGFFPTPEPLRSIHSNLTMIPTPELDLYIREARDMSIGAARIANLVNKIRARAFYAAMNADKLDKLNSAGDDEYIAIDDMDGITQVGGMQNFFAHDPIEIKQQVAQGLYLQQDNLLQEIYEITGISDIQHNISPQETATATLAKGRFGSLRLRSRQKRINDYIKGVYSIAAEIICERFTIETLKEITSMELPHSQDKMQYQLSMQMQDVQYNQMVNDAQMQGVQSPQPPPVDKVQAKFFERPSWEEVKEFLENDRLRSYMMDMETTFNVWEMNRKKLNQDLIT
ncbi:hypothetical protein AGMMS49950_07650 [Endomicrobiia bacterium]|nr:hypothetical protein AGMMS49950_07650 [Endomicrobiia bacterium]